MKKDGKSGADGCRDSEFYMSHYQKDAATDKGFVSLFNVTPLL